MVSDLTRDRTHAGISHDLVEAEFARSLHLLLNFVLLYANRNYSTMKVSALFLAVIGSTAAFAPTQNAAPRTSALSAVEDMVGINSKIGLFDPFGLADMGSDSTLAWFRAAELKHSRVAMLATAGYLAQASGLHFPGMLSVDEGVSFESLSAMKPFDAWEAVPEGGQQQIIGAILLTEIITESQGTHYTKGGDLPTVVFPPFTIGTNDAAKLRVRQDVELTNGRLAMIGIMSFVAAANVPGSVPFLEGNPMW